MRFKATTWILVAALVATAAYFFFVEERSRVDKEFERRVATKLFFYEMKDIAGFTLVNPEGERIDIEHEGDDWRIVHPIAVPGDVPTITSFIGQVVPGRRIAAVADARDPADYGLADPFATLIIRRIGDAPPDTLFVGDKTPTSSNSYVRLGSSGPILISSDITHNVMKKNLFHLRDKEFLAIDAGSIDSIAVTSGSRTLRLRRDGADWRFAGQRLRADRLTIEPYIDALGSAIIHGFVREDTKELSSYGLAPASKRLAFRRGGETIRILFGSKKDDKVHVVRDGLDKVVLLEDRLLAPFDWTAESLRALNLSFFKDDSVRVARYETPDTSVVFRRAGRKWTTAEADSTGLRSWEMNSLLRKLASIRFEGIVAESFSPNDGPLASPLVRITLENGAGAVIDRIAIAPAGETNEYGASMSAGCLGVLPPGTFDAIHAIFLRIGSGA